VYRPLCKIKGTLKLSGVVRYLLARTFSAVEDIKY